MTADDAALYAERDDALLRAERAELREAELEQELAAARRLTTLIVTEALHAEHMEVLAEKDAEIAELRAALKGDLGIFGRRDE